MQSYLRRVSTAFNQFDGEGVARALSLDDADMRQLAGKIPNGPRLDMLCGDALASPWDEVVSHLLQRTDGAFERPAPPIAAVA